jgi:hypothetical protein
VPGLAALACAVLAACSGGCAPSADRGAASPSAQSPASSSHIGGPLGSPGNPLVMSCADESWPGYPATAPVNPGPHDLAVGPMYFANARLLATETPAQHGYASFGDHGRFYKFGVVVRPGAIVTVTIGGSGRGHAMIVIGPDAVISATYHACRQAGGFFAGGLAFTRPPYRGCVPLDVTAGAPPRVWHSVISLFAGSCAR